jgi:hypothetical protein
MAEEQGEERRIAPKGAHLPQTPLDEALPIARALNELAAPSTPQRIAHRLSVSPSGGRFRSRMGAARYYGLIRHLGERRELTDLGLRALNEDADGMAARRQAVLNTGFRDLFSLLRGREASEQLIQARLQDDEGVPGPASASIAGALIESGQQTGLIRGGRFDTEAIEEALLASAETDETRPKATRSGRESQPKTLRAVEPAAPRPGPSVGSGRPVPAVHIDVQVHIPTTATNDQIDQIFASMAKHLYGRE